MKSIETLFVVHRARSKLFSDYDPGDTAYVGNGMGDNAIVGFVKALPGDKVFKFTGITVSAFCEATVQTPPFIACGRAGNGLVILEPREPMKLSQLAYIAAYINQALRWRFSWYWQTTADRLRRLPIPDSIPEITFDVPSVLPKASLLSPRHMKGSFKLFPLGDIYDLVPGYFHNAATLKPGPVPLISCGDLDNGIVGYIASSDHTHQDRFTIALNGSPLTTKYHPYKFSAKDDVAVCNPRSPLRLTTGLFIQTMLNRERWRYSYYRKCYIDKLKRFQVALPHKNGGLDEAEIRAVVEATSYWKFIEAHQPKSEG